MVRMDTLNFWQVPFCKGSHRVMLSIPNFSQMITTLTSISRVLPQCIIAPPFPWCQFQPGASLCSWPSLTPCHQKGLSSNYPGHFIKFVFTTLTFQFLLLVFYSLISFLDLLSSWNSLLWLTHFCFLLLALQPPKTLAFSKALTHSPMSSRLQI